MTQIGFIGAVRHTEGSKAIRPPQGGSARPENAAEAKNARNLNSVLPPSVSTSLNPTDAVRPSSEAAGSQAENNIRNEIVTSGLASSQDASDASDAGRGGHDNVSISEAARDLAEAARELEQFDQEADEHKREEVAVSKARAEETTEATRQKNKTEGSEVNGLNEAEKEVVDELKGRDREVRTHEHAHASIGGLYAGAPSYTYQRGPDGRSYAVGGEVSIDVSPGKTPEETIRKMQTIRRAALAPAQPSSQDRQVAQAAAALELEANTALMQEREDPEAEEVGKTPDSTGSDELKPDALEPESLIPDPLNPKEDKENRPHSGAGAFNNIQEQDSSEADNLVNFIV